MNRIILVGVGGYALFNAAFMLLAPQLWYAEVPGVAATGPLNLHFATDVALAFLSSGLALVWAGVKVDFSAAVFGSCWLMLHALFHVSIWVQRGFPADFVAVANLLGIQLPAMLAAGATLRTREDKR
ncbi:hypothetical protein AB2B41_03075 [Marimonas sp. MJW-29]|uniref:Uncharacterized protein n=1 Tax=Sulfitobacter sediminis TaxID=3234186 RepID=A0ABV3RHY1_9RHOB